MIAMLLFPILMTVRFYFQLLEDDIYD